MKSRNDELREIINEKKFFIVDGDGTLYSWDNAQLQVRCFSSEWVIVGHPLIECFCRHQEIRRANLYIGGNLDSLQKSNNYEHCTQEIIDGFIPHSKGSFGKIQSRN